MKTAKKTTSKSKGKVVAARPRRRTSPRRRVRKKPNLGREEAGFRIPPLLLEGDPPRETPTANEETLEVTLAGPETVDPSAVVLPSVREPLPTVPLIPHLPELRSPLLDRPVTPQGIAPPSADEPSGPALSQPKAPVGPSAAAHTPPSALHAHAPEPPGDQVMPSSNGRLRLIARDPYSLYVDWLFTATAVPEKPLILRLYLGSLSGELVAQLAIAPSAQYQFVPVETAAAKYVAELGYRANEGHWVSVLTSAPAVTPAVAPAPEGDLRFATLIQPEPSAPPLYPVAGQAPPCATDSQWPGAVTVAPPLSPAPVPAVAAQPSIRPDDARFTGLISSPEVQLPPVAPGWNPRPVARPAGISSPAEASPISQLPTTARPPETPQGLSSSPAGGAQFALPSAPGEAPGPASPQAAWGEQEVPRRFWLGVNAELVIFGATEPNAKVTLAGRPIQLRPDGTFSFRFALPDGRFELPVVAVAADRSDGRAALLTFSRESRHQGAVEALAPDAALKAPQPENVPTTTHSL